jgi:hypothetical protein
MDDKIYVRSHALWTEAPDTLVFRIQGVVTEEDANAVTRIQQAFSEGKSYFLLLGDMTGLESVTSQARRVIATMGMHGPPRGISCFGISARLTPVADFIFRAMNLLEGGRNRFRFAHDEAHARAYLDEMRTHFKARTLHK